MILILYYYGNYLGYKKEYRKGGRWVGSEEGVEESNKGYYLFFFFRYKVVSKTFKVVLFLLISFIFMMFLNVKYLISKINWFVK